MSNHDRYPHMPGFRRGAPDTSREAGESIAPIAASIRSRVISAIREVGEAGRTGDGVASVLDLTPVQVRARIAELHAAKLIVDSGRRQKLESGRRGVVWIAAEYAPKPDDPQLSLPVAA